MNIITDIHERAAYNKPITHFDLPKGIGQITAKDIAGWAELNNLVYGAENYSSLTYNNNVDANPDMVKSTSAAIMQAPDETFSTILTEEAQQVQGQVNSYVSKNFVQMFYETYMAPINTKDVNNRLGKVLGVVSDMHSLIPNGVPGIMAADNTASWKTTENFSFKFSEGLSKSHPDPYKTRTLDGAKWVTTAYRAWWAPGGWVGNPAATDEWRWQNGRWERGHFDGGEEIFTEYHSLAFPPYHSHEVVNTENLFEPKASETENATASLREYKADRTYDMENLLYKKGIGTYRTPAFKAINDNIQTLQLFFNRCFGIESTYINEWDESLYIQEGLCNVRQTTDAEGNTVSAPSFVTTLTYGLLDDAPVPGVKGSSAVDLNKITPFASWNMAVSTRSGVDYVTTAQHCNEMDYMIKEYPLSTYWYPEFSGQNLGDMNVSRYIDDMFAYRENGANWDENVSRNYTSAIKYGSLDSSTKSLLEVINYTDDKQAVLSGMNATDKDGKLYLLRTGGAYINDGYGGNAYSYLPFWRQFFTSAEDGLSDIDILMQDVLYNDQEYNSYLDIGHRIIEMTTSDNSKFWDYLNQRSGTFNPLPPTASQIAQDNNASILQDASSYGNIKIDIGIASFEIPHTALLKAWANKDKNTRAAMNKANQTGGMDNAVSVVNSNLKPTKKKASYVEDVNGAPQVVNEYTPEEDDDEAAKSALSYGAGVNNYSPFLYGGPHGQYLSPLTLEGYCQDENRFLATVPTQDSYTYYHNGIDKNYLNRTYSNFTKNYKNRGNFYDKVTAVTPNERELLLTGNVNFGFLPKPQPNNYRWVYYSNYYYNYEMVTGGEYTTNAGTESAPRRYWDYAGRRNHYHNGQLTPATPSWMNNWWGNAIWGWIVTFNNSSKSTYSSGYLNDGYDDHHHYSNTYVLRHFGKYYWEEDVNLSPDFPYQDFMLLPVGQSLSDRGNINWDYIKSTIDIDHNNRIQTDQFISHETWEVEDKSKPWRYQRLIKVQHYNPVENIVDWNAHCWYLVTPDKHPSNTWVDGTRYVTYSERGSAWYNALERMWRPSAGNEILCTLPINSGGGITNVVCAVGRIIKDFTYVYRYVWRLHLGWRWSWRWSWHWFHFHWWGGFYWYWKLHRIVGTETTYNLYIDTNRTRYNIPTKYLIDREAKVNSSRKFESSNPVERYATGETGGESGHLGTTGAPLLCPWEPRFKDYYGWYNNSKAMPGAYWSDEGNQYYRGGYHSGAFLMSRGIFFADMIENYRKHGQEAWYCTSTVPIVKSKIENFYITARTKQSVGCNRWGYGTTSYVNNYNYRTGRYTYGLTNDNYWKYSDFYTYDDTHYHTLLCWADRANWVPNRWATHWTLTNIFREMPRTKSLIEYCKDGNNPTLAWYHATDPFDVYIDTAQQQIQWMKQLHGYVVNNITDKNIWDVYQKVTDKKIKNVTKMKNNAGSWNSNVMGPSPYFTNSFTEDVNYFDALDVVYRVFGANAGNPKKNTIAELLAERIYYLEKFRNRALYLRNQLLVDSLPADIVRQFSILVSNTRLYLNCAQCYGRTVENTSYWGNEWYLSNVLMYSDHNTRYNLMRHPGTVLWAYLNVLYQARKYWVNLRLDKSFGSYWLLRGLERVLVFTMAQDTAVVPNLQEASSAVDVEDSTKKTSRKIHFVESRSKLEELIDNDSMEPTYTNAVYIKVDYLNVSDPTTNELYKNGKFDNKEIRYIPEVYKWAYKPTDQEYYVMSAYITSHLKEYTQTRKQVLDEIYACSYRLTANDYDKLRTSLTYLQESYIDKTLSSLGTLPEMEYRLEELQNALLQEKSTYYNGLIEDLLYPVYIKFEPEHVWTGNYKDDEKDGKYYIDEWQKEETAYKERTRRDSFGEKHKHTAPISAGITFDVMASIDVNKLLNNIGALQTATTAEILCECKNTMDLWRIELPKNMKVPTAYLEDKPILVPAFLIDLSVNGVLAKEKEPTPRDVLVGVSSTEMLPILEPSAGLLTVNTQAALGIVDKVDFGINVNVQELKDK